MAKIVRVDEVLCESDSKLEVDDNVPPPTRDEDDLPLSYHTLMRLHVVAAGSYNAEITSDVEMIRSLTKRIMRSKILVKRECVGERDI